MNDYQHLINELTWFAENDQDFIDPQDSINTKAAEALKALVAERDELLTALEQMADNGSILSGGEYSAPATPTIIFKPEGKSK